MSSTAPIFLRSFSRYLIAATKSDGIERALVERSLQAQLDVELQAAHFAEIVFAGVEEHSVEQRSRGFQRWRIAGTQLAINLDQRFLRSANGVLLKRAAHHDSYVVAVGEGNVHFRDSSFGNRSEHLGRERLVGFEQNFAGLSVHQLADGDGAFQIGWSNFHLRDARLAQLLEKRLGNALVRANQSFAGLGMLDFFRQLAVDQAFGKIPEKLAIAQRNAFHLIERAQNVFIRLHSQRAKEDRAQEFALAVDAHVQNVFRVVLELNPRSAVGNNLSRGSSCGCSRFRKRRPANGATG